MKKKKVLVLMVISLIFLVCGGALGSGYFIRANSAARTQKQSLKHGYFKECHRFHFSGKDKNNIGINSLSRYNLLGSAIDSSTKFKVKHVAKNSLHIDSGVFVNQTELSSGTYQLYLYTPKLTRADLKQLKLFVIYSDGNQLVFKNFKKGNGYISKVVTLNQNGQIGFLYNTLDKSNGLTITGYGILGRS